MSTLEDMLVGILSDRILEVFRTRAAGHCAQVPQIPLALADKVANALEDDVTEHDRVYVVMKDPVEPWHASPAKVVECRNEGESDGSRMVVLVPAGSHLPVEDSFSATTFEVIDTSDVYEESRRRSLERLQGSHPEVAERVEDVLRQTQGRSEYGVDADDAARFANEVAEHPDAIGLGRSMARLGLVPDTGLLDVEADEVEARLRRNLQQIERLSTSDAPVDRVREVVVGDDEDAAALRQELAGALSGTGADRHDVAERLAAIASKDGASLAALVGKEASAPAIDELKILRLEGDLDTSFDPPRTTGRQPSVKALVRCNPPARLIVGLSHLRLSVLHRPERTNELLDVGISKTRRVGSLGRRTDFTWSAKLDAEGREGGLEAGQYLMQVEAVDEDNFVREVARSEPFVLREASDDESDVEREVTSQVHAALEARKAADGLPGVPTITYVRPGDAVKAPRLTEDFVIRFADAPGSYKLALPRLLTQIESWTIANPRDPMNYTLASDGQEAIDQDPVRALPEAFLDSRERALHAIAAHQVLTDDDAPSAVATCDLRAVEEAVHEYVDAWRGAVEEAEGETRESLLALDQAKIKDIEAAVLVGPTHPLRLGWLVTFAREMYAATENPSVLADDLRRLLTLIPALSAANVPHILVSGGRELRYLDALTTEWGVWVHPGSPDPSSLATELRRQLLGLRRAPTSLSAADVVRRIERYLLTHPYVRTLQLNVVQPGSADVMVEALLTLQSDSRFADTRYLVRLFGGETSRSKLGSALDTFMADPESLPARRKEAADAFLASQEDILAPKLTYSKHDLSELADAPERFPAHLSIFIDWFQLDAVPVPPLEGRRSFYAEGVLIDPVVVFRPGEGGFDPQWDEHVVAPVDGGWFSSAYRTGETASANLLGAGREGSVPAIRLQLDRVRRAVLDAVHRTSDWVVVIDPVFTEEFLDHQREGAARYLIDSEQRESARMSRNVVVSTRSRLELAELLRPALETYGLEVGDARIEALINAMHALNPGLALRLLNAPTHAVEALTLALAAIELEAQGVLRRSLVIPLDLHQDLFREELELRSEGIVALSRTDIALVRPQPDERVLDIHLVEVKARADLPARLPDQLLDGVAEQLRNSQRVLKSALLGVEQRVSEAQVVAWLRARRLMRLLGRYVDRAERYGHLPQETVPGIRDFLTTLDGSFEARFALHLIIFDLGDTTEPEVETRFGEMQIHRIGRTRIESLLAEAPTRLQTRPALRPVEPTDILDTGVPSEQTSVPAITTGITTSPPEERDEDAGAEEAPVPDSTDTQPGGSPASEQGPAIDEVMLIGKAESSSQFGVVGHLKSSNQPVAFDVDGTNVVSVFGVQGAGKSYTVGNLIEAALIREPALNRLTNPLGVVVFHFSNTPSYRPEFASMIDANDDPEQVEALRELGASPRAVDDVRLVVPRGVIADREAEFAGRIPVEPLALAPEDLDLSDWKLLMGVEGGEQMYVKTMMTLLAGLRDELSLEGLRGAVAESRLSPAQKNIAETRLDFVARFVEDGAGVSGIAEPGRLVIVDVRDPLMDKSDALALFMVLLRLFSVGEDSSGRRFNPLIVFDEAHKYMADAKLTNAIVEAIREMRHKGTSVVIASQDPPSVPKEVIELSSVIVAHRFTSPQWLSHIKKVNAAFASDITPPQLAKLASGEAFVVSDGGDPIFRRPQLVRMRPRLTRHGGTTRRAVVE